MVRFADGGVGDEEHGGAAGSAHDNQPHVQETASAANGKEGSEHIAASETSPVEVPAAARRGCLAGIAAALKPQVFCLCILQEQRSLMPTTVTS